MTTDRRSAHRLGAVLALGMFVALGCNSASPRTGGDTDTGGSGPEDTGGSTGSTGGKSGTPTGGKSGGTGGASATGGAGGSSDTGGAGGSTGGAGGSSDTGGAGGSTGGAGGSTGGAGGGTGGKAGTGGMAGTGGKSGTGGAGGNNGLDPSGQPISMLDCNSPGLVWKTANKTHYTSYPVPGSEECIKFNGCFWQGKFNTCGDTLVKTKAWVMTHNIIALFPLKTYGLHAICVKGGGKTIEVTAYDTCGDSDCSGCCTQNKGSADALIDFESYTDKKAGIGDGKVMWADLGYKGATCTDSP
jgi:hypothetical protein